MPRTVLAPPDPGRGLGLAAARSCYRGDFNAWTGSTGVLPEPLMSTVNAHLSATTLQNWASCPSRHLYGEVLGVRDLEDRGGEDTIDAREKGTLFHGVLEALISSHLGTMDTPGISPDTAWSAADIARARALLAADAAPLTERGLTGREGLWSEQVARLQRVLARVLAGRLAAVWHPSRLPGLLRPAALGATGRGAGAPGLRRGIPHLPLVVQGHRVQVGPLITGGGGPCLSCLDLHRRDRDAAWPAVLSQLAAQGPFLPGAPVSLESSLAAMAIGAAAMIVHTCLDGQPVSDDLGLELSLPWPTIKNRRGFPQMGRGHV